MAMYVTGEAEVMRLQGEEHQGLPATTVSWERRGQIRRPGRSRPSDTLASDFWLPELGENELMEFHPPVYGTLSRPPWQTTHWVNTLEWPSEPRVIDCPPWNVSEGHWQCPSAHPKASEAPMVGSRHDTSGKAPRKGLTHKRWAWVA